MPLLIGEPPSPSFAQPLALLSDCHRRVRHFLGLLAATARDLGGGTLDPRYRDALEASLRYFREAAPRHTADEEVSLFPRLRLAAPQDARALLQRVFELEHDHRLAGPWHEEADRLGRRWLADGHLNTADAARLTAIARRLESLYQPHIDLEDHEVFPFAARVLSPDDLIEVGREMAARRGLPLLNPSPRHAQSDPLSTF